MEMPTSGACRTTIFHYTVFLNAVAKRDTYPLSNTEMTSIQNSAGMIRSGPSGNQRFRNQACSSSRRWQAEAC